MRLGYKKFKEIKKWYGSSDFEIGYNTNCLTLRFGYWSAVDIEGLEEILPDWIEVIEVAIEDDDCGWNYSYELYDNRFGK